MFAADPRMEYSFVLSLFKHLLFTVIITTTEREPLLIRWISFWTCSNSRKLKKKKHDRSWVTTLFKKSKTRFGSNLTAVK